VLVTDHVEDDGRDDKRILAEYRHQHIVEGHSGFRWLKGPAAVAPMFLKTPERIAALGLVFVLALMVRNWLQREVRQRLAEQGEKLPNMNKRHTDKPTTENVFHYFEAVTVVMIYRDGKVVERHVGNLTGPAMRALEILGIDPAIFTTPPKFGRRRRRSAE
jgi:transposase